MAAIESENQIPDTIGETLRKTREAQGKSIDDAAAVTRIGKNYLLAIENDAHEKLPSPAYIKGFLRIYASYLGLSGAAIVSQYEREQGSASSRNEPPTAAGNQPHPTRREKRIWWLVPLVLLALVISLSLFTTPGKRSTSTLSTEKAPEAGLPAPPVAQKYSSAAVPAAEVPPTTTPETTPPPASTTAGPDGIILRLKANRDSALNIMIDGTISQPYELKAGDIIEWKAQESFTLDLSNAGGVEATFNGKQLPPLGTEGKAAHLVLKRDTSDQRR